MKRNLILILLAIFSLVMVACSSSDNEEGNGESKETDKDGDELLIGGAIMNYAWPWFFRNDGRNGRRSKKL
ncbi:hypothetical protein ACFSKI_05075 [Pseudogracilibacillus auburnensis]|uniref:hypothetical protein n=1 Tax=Pseudogracilibacillus auburnensis TaxID=1494959 RepID=UPI0036317393